MARWRTGVLVAQPATAVQAGPEAPHGRTKRGICHRTGPWRFWQESLHRPAFAGLCPETPEIVAACACCIRRPQPLGASIARAAMAPVLDVECVSKALRSFPADTAPGPTGLRIQHVRDALGLCGRCSHGPVDGVVNLLVQGHACSSIMPLLAGRGCVQ